MSSSKRARRERKKKTRTRLRRRRQHVSWVELASRLEHYLVDAIVSIRWENGVVVVSAELFCDYNHSAVCSQIRTFLARQGFNFFTSYCIKVERGGNRSICPVL